MWLPFVGQESKYFYPCSIQQQSILRSCLVPQCSHTPHWYCHQPYCVLQQRTIFLFSRTSNLLRFVTKDVSSASCHGVWRSVLISSHSFIGWECKASQIETICTHRTATRQFIWRQRRAALWAVTDGVRSGWRTLEDSVLSPTTSAPTFPEWLCQKQRGSGLTASAPVSDVSSPAHTNGIWPLLRLVSMAQRNRRWPCCISLSNPSTYTWSAQPERSGQRDNGMAA